MKKLIALACLTIAFAASACAKTGTVNETQAFSADLASYKSASVEVQVAPGVTNAEATKTQMTEVVGAKLRERKLFSDTPPSGGDVTVKVKLASVDGGNKAMQAMGGGGDAEVKANVELFDTKQNKVVGAFDVSGNSKSNSHVSVGGVDTKAMGDATATALAAAADQIADYLDKHRAPAAK